MPDLETLLHKLPPALDVANTEEFAWLTLSTDTRGKTWTAGYQNNRGGLLVDFVFEGDSPQEALIKLDKRLDKYRASVGVL